MGELPEQVPSLTPSINPLQPVQSTFDKTQSDPSTAAARKLDATVARVSPALYAAGSRAALTREEKNLIENWAKVRDTHKQLMKMSNEDAGDSYNKLEPGFQEVLKTYYKVDYANKTESSALIQNEALRKALGIEDNDFEFLDAIKSPFKFLMGAATQYGKYLNTPGAMLQNSIVNKESFWSRSNGEAAFDGKYLYDNALADELINKYGSAESFVAMHVLAGDTPGEIIDAWGPNDPAILAAVNTMFNEEESFGFMLDEFSRAKLSPGRAVGRLLGFDAGTKPFSAVSGTVDAAYQIFMDPLTYLTFGASAVIKGASKAEKLAEIVKSGDDVPAFLARPEVAEIYTGYTKRIGELGDALAVKATTPKAEVAKAARVANARKTLEEEYPELSNPLDVEVWLNAGVRDLETFKNSFVGEGAEEFTRLIRGRTLTTSYAREGAVYAKRSRTALLNGKEHLRNFFLGKQVDEVDGVAEYATIIPKLLKDEPLDIQLAVNRKQNGFQRFIERQTRLHPGRAAVFHDDDNYMRTIEIFKKQAFMGLGRRDLTDLVTARYMMGTEAERFALHRSVFELILRREGIHGMEGGQRYIDETLELHFGSKGKNTFTTGSQLSVPARAGISDGPTDISVSGSLHSSQFQNYVSAPDWRGISEFKASKSLTRSEDQGLADYIPQLIGGAYNNRITGVVTDVWTTLTLIPQLGVRTAIDEGFMFLMYANAGLLKHARTSKQYQRIYNAALGLDEKAGVGPVKAGIETLATKLRGKPIGASRSIDSAQRAEIRTDVLANNRDLPFWKQEEIIRERIIDTAIAMHGGKLTPLQTKWFKELVMDNPAVLHSISTKQVTDAVQGKVARMEFNNMLTKSQLDMAMDDLGLVAQGAIRSFEVRSMKDSDLNIAMFRNFTRIFNDKGFEMRNGKDVSRFSFASVFLKYDGITNPEDWAKATDELMSNFGFIQNGKGAWVPKVGKAKGIQKLINRTRFFDDMENLDDAAKMQQFIKAGLSDTYATFHGSAQAYNPKLIKFFDDYVNGKVFDHRALMDNITFEKYVEATEGFKFTGNIMTDIKFDGLAVDLATAVRSFGSDGAFDMMARTSDSVTRLPVTHMHYIAFREQYTVGENKMVADLYKSRIKELEAQGKKITEEMKDSIQEASEEQASKFFANKAINDAAQHVLKFSDNPAVQSIFAYNMRTVGRFYRAVEDFQRRMYRLVKDHPLDVIYRLRLMNQGFDAVGDVHTDGDGQKYVILPFDDVIYSAVDTTVRALTNNKHSIKQPLFNDLTFNLTAGNPSFQTDAGMPYLSGPMGSFSVLAAKSMLGVFNPTKNFSEDLDNLLLGDLGDNVSLGKSFTPKIARNIWGMLNIDEKSTQEISAMTQAISYNQANGYSINPKDPKYVLPDGSVNQALLAKDQADYLKSIRIGAHNIIVTRALLGLILPFSVQTKSTKDLPEYLLDSGITSMQESFYEVLDQIKSKYPDATDHYEMALATWMGENPGKVAYVVSKKSKEIQPVMNYTKKMQDWAIANGSAIEQYGSGALLFAPRVGEFTPGVWQWATAVGIAKNTDIEEYYSKVTMQQHVNEYYSLSDQEALELKSIPFNNIALRREVMAQYDRKKEQLQLSVPGLENYIKSGVDNTDAFDFVNNAYNYATSSGSNIPKEARENISLAYNLYVNFIASANFIDSLDTPNAADLKRAEKEKTINAIKEIIASDSTKTVEQYFNYGLSKLINARSKDASAGLRRNE
jgi:hypothetical protein